MTIHGKASHIVHGAHDISAWMNSIDFSDTVDTAETTGFQRNSKEYTVGTDTATINAGGRFQGNIDAVDGYIADEIDAEAKPAVTLGWGLPIRANDVAVFGSAIATTFATSSPVGDVVSVSLNTQVDGALYEGVHLLPAGAAPALGATIDLGAAYGDAAAVIHVLENGSTADLTVRVQTSANGTTWVDAASLVLGAGQKGSRIVKLPTAPSRYVRAATTKTGTAPVRAFVAIGR